MEQPKVTFRTATVTDTALLRYWDSQPHVWECDPDPDDWNWEEELQRAPSWREMLIAELNGKATGFVQIIDPEQEDSHYWGSVEPGLRAIDIWIGEADQLNKGYGTQMMHLALERCFAQPRVTAVLIDPLENNTRAHRFYERIGFTFLRDQVFGTDHCRVYRLTREVYLQNRPTTL